MTPTARDYWLRRYEIAIQSAAGAPGDRSRIAYLDLARHYWSMHMMVVGRQASTLLPAITAKIAGPPIQEAA
jgi:hypothetical protein